MIVSGCAQGVPFGGDPGVDAGDDPGVTPDAEPVDAPTGPDAPPPIGYACAQAPSFPDNDRCSSAIDLTPAAATPAGALVYGDTAGYADDLEPSSSYTGGFSLNGADAVYRVQLTAGQTLTATLTTDSAAFDASLYVLHGCDSDAFVAGSSGTSGPGTESLAYTAATSTTYYVIVDSYHETEEGCYALHVTTTAP